MNKRSIIIIFLLFGFFSYSQNKELMTKYESSLRELFFKTYNEPTDNERYNANEQAISLLTEALNEHRSFHWTWSSLKEIISILESKDKKIRVFTWPIIRDNGEYECFGLMQVENEKTNEYDIIPLIDKSDAIISPEEAVLSSNNWYGVVYYDLITTKYEDKTYYTLLGWTGNNPVYQKKVIETLSFKSFSTNPVFGQRIFHKESKRRRVIFEYSKNANMVLEYGNQHYVESKKIKKTRTKPAKVVETEFKEDMIIFDVLESHLDGLGNLPQYYIPNGETNAYSWDKNKWVLKENILPRIKKNKKLDNPQPYVKDKPSYEVPKNYEY